MEHKWYKRWTDTLRYSYNSLTSEDDVLSTECPEIYRKSVMNLIKYRFVLYIQYKAIAIASLFDGFPVFSLRAHEFIIYLSYWVTQKLPQIYTANHATFPIRF